MKSVVMPPTLDRQQSRDLRREPYPDQQRVFGNARHEAVGLVVRSGFDSAANGDDEFRLIPTGVRFGEGQLSYARAAHGPKPAVREQENARFVAVRRLLAGLLQMRAAAYSPAYPASS
jgi:hypothetical protein